MSESQTLFGKCRLGTARFQTSTIRSVKNTNLKTKIPRKPCFLNILRKLTKRFFTKPQGHMGTQEILRVIRRHTLEAILPVMETAVKLSQRAKTIEKTCSTPGVFWPHHRAYRKKLATASAGNPMNVTKPSLLLLFVQQDENCLEELTSLKETYVSKTFGKKSMTKVRSKSKLASILTVVHVA